MLFSKSTSYKYRPLDVSNDEIRVLRILPGDPADEIRCRLDHIPLDNVASYEALSYAWHDPTLFPDENRQPNEILQIDGRCIRVGSNVLSFLRTARIKRPESGWLWIDAICINQDDAKERNAQVLRMRRIYQMARHVIVWLGPQAGDSNKAIDFLKFVFTDCPRGHESAWFKDFLNFNSIAVQWKALTRLLWRVWWTRLWTVQEVVLAREVVVLCGTSALAWAELEYSVTKVAAALDDMWKHVQGFGGISIVRERVKGIAQLAALRRQRDNINFIDALDKVGRYDCTNSRDKIYGLLGLIKDASRLFPSPDYTLSPESVYRSTFVSIAMESRDLDFLSLVQNRPDDPNSSALPTWCPDTRSTQFHSIPRLNTSLILPANSTPQFRTSLNKSSAARSSKDRSVLTLPGICIDTIDGVFPGGFDNPLILKYTTQPRSNCSMYKSEEIAFEALWTSFVAGLNLSSKSKDYSAPTHFGEIFARFSCGAEQQHQQLCMEGRETAFDISKPLKRPLFIAEEPVSPFNTWYKYNRKAIFGGRSIQSWAESNHPAQKKIAGGNPVNEVSMQNAFSISWASAQSARRMVTTEKGYVGMVPEVSRRGDIVCVLFGSKMPVILRPKGRHFLFIGECYMHGLMFGESMDDLKRGLYRVSEFELH